MAGTGRDLPGAVISRVPRGPPRPGRGERGVIRAGGRRERVSAPLHQCCPHTCPRDSSVVPALLPDTSQLPPHRSQSHQLWPCTAPSYTSTTTLLQSHQCSQ